MGLSCFLFEVQELRRIDVRKLISEGVAVTGRLGINKVVLGQELIPGIIQYSHLRLQVRQAVIREDDS